MKRKIIVGLGVFSIIFLFGGLYIITTIESATATLDNLITLHRVEILREKLLLQIKRVQADINLKNTRYARSMDTVIANVRNMERLADGCLDCHHSEEMTFRLEHLQEDVDEYKKSISRLFTIRANVQRLEEEEDRTFRTGEELIASVNNMITMAGSKLESKTQTSLREIAGTKIILYALVTTLPLFTALLGFIFIRGLTHPVNILLQATRKIKSGELDYKIEGLKDEFGEVADSFNEMSQSLEDSMRSIRENEKRYRMLFESAGDAIFILEAEGEEPGRIVSANKAAADMHGYTVDELLKLNLVKDLDSPDDFRDAPERIKRIMNGEWIKAEIFHRMKDGTVFPVEISAGLLEFMGHKYILAFDRDITERKKSEEAIIRSYIMFVTVLDSIDAIIYVADLNTYEILYINSYARKLFGDLEGKTCWQTLQAGQYGPCSFCSNDKLLNPDGSPGGVYQWECQNTVNGRWYEIRDSAIEWMDGRLVRMEIATDITERKKVEETLKRAEQMKLVGEWAAGLAHEIKNSLAGIKISVEVLGSETNMPEEDKETIFRAVDEIKRIEMLLKSLLSFAKPPKLQLTVMDINEILDKTIDFSLKQSYITPGEAGIKILKELDAGLPKTQADAQQMQQVFMNLLLNARDAMKGGGTLTARSYYDAQEDTIHVDISDTGEGVDEKLLDKIFQPFVTTKSKGTGLGLAISKRIIEQHGGKISAGNKPGGGVIFYISLPVKH
jgi:two-component system cell cycle sensor histidine kinase/response regulator CckA